MKPIKYLQIIKTTDAELKGYANLADDVKSKILPLFELTRSRTSSRVPEGSIHRRLANIKDAIGNNPFILDLTSHEDLMNYQIEELLDDNNGFSAWTDFIKDLNTSQVIPAIHVYQDGDPENIIRQVSMLCETNERVAFRVGSEDEELEFYLEKIKEGLINEQQLIIIIDAEHITERNYHSKKSELEQQLLVASRVTPQASISVCCSSFPKSVLVPNAGGDAYGKLPLYELTVFEELKNVYPAIIYGDYASIHPFRYQTGGGGWVPRIDYPLHGYIVYHRYRRDDGSYTKCAEELVSDSDFDNLHCWGTEQIHSCLSGGEPNGKSPSFWISVRLNIHITRKANYFC